MNSAVDLMAFDVVLTTYDTVAAKFKNKSISEAQSLHAYEWHRVVLDEGEQRMDLVREALAKLSSQRMSFATLSQSGIMLC